MKCHLLVVPEKKLKIWFFNHNIITNVGGATNTTEAQSRNMIKICTKYGFDSFIISGSYGGHRRHTTDKGQCTTDDRQRQGYGISSPQVS